jgi:adenine nucleotide transporter 17
MSALDRLFTYQTLVHAVAGSVSSVTAMSVFYPLDTIRSRLQVEDREAKSTPEMIKEILQKEGL